MDEVKRFFIAYRWSLVFAFVSCFGLLVFLLIFYPAPENIELWAKMMPLSTVLYIIHMIRGYLCLLKWEPWELRRRYPLRSEREGKSDG